MPWRFAQPRVLVGRHAGVDVQAGQFLVEARAQVQRVGQHLRRGAQLSRERGDLRHFGLDAGFRGAPRRRRPEKSRRGSTCISARLLARSRSCSVSSTIPLVYDPCRCRVSPCARIGPISTTMSCSTSGWRTCPLAIEDTLAERLDQLRGRARGPRPDVPAAFLPVGRVVHAGRRHGDRDPLLSGASAAGAARRVTDAGGRRRRTRVVHADPAARGGPCDRQRVPAAAAPAAAPDVRPADKTVSRVLHAEAVQQELRAAPGCLVRAEPSRRGLRRDVRGLADPGERMAAAVRRLAGAQEARVHGRAHGVDRRSARRASSIPTKSIRCAG